VTRLAAAVADRYRIERFVVEIKTTASLQHPHILPLFDSGTADGFLFYVTPFVEGETLRDKLNRETQLGVDEAVRIALPDGVHRWIANRRIGSRPEPVDSTAPQQVSIVSLPLAPTSLQRNFIV
jgi:hypothetical protein